MKLSEVLMGELLDDTTLTLAELAKACHVEEQWVIERVEAGIIKGAKQLESWCFVSKDLARARRLVSIERSFDTDADLAALVTDLIEEVSHLKQQLKIAELQSRK